MSDRSERGERISRRFDDEPEPEEEEESQTAQPSKKSKKSKTDMTAETATTSKSEEKESVKERPSVLMYLPEDLRNELDAQFDELNAAHKREHGEGIEKNRDYYPAVVEAGLTGKDVEDVLDL